MKTTRKFFFSLALIIIIVLSVSITAYADNTTSSISQFSSNNSSYIFTIETAYGTYYIPSGTVVGYNNTISGYYVEGCQAGLTQVNNYSTANCYPGEIDGLFGQATYNAIYNFQSWAFLEPDGYAGDYTFAKLEYWCDVL